MGLSVFNVPVAFRIAFSSPSGDRSASVSFRGENSMAMPPDFPPADSTCAGRGGGAGAWARRAAGNSARKATGDFKDMNDLQLFWFRNQSRELPGAVCVACLLRELTPSSPRSCGGRRTHPICSCLARTPWSRLTVTHGFPYQRRGLLYFAGSDGVPGPVFLQPPGPALTPWAHLLSRSGARTIRALIPEPKASGVPSERDGRGARARESGEGSEPRSNE